MQDAKTAIMDAAERRMQMGGFGGFSFREIAADVGIKSSSVHYHFPAKENLAAAVVRRWGDRAFEHLDELLRTERDPARALAKLFRGTVFSKGGMCPCTVLGAGAQDLPAEVAIEVKSFFKGLIDKLVDAGLAPSKADEVLSTMTGAIVLANALGDRTAYDRATNDVLGRRKAA
jgi:TetR/AcrR family transcriptional regulator, transcriptional repressor for nem operon